MSRLKLGSFCMYRKCENWNCCTLDPDFDFGTYYALSKRPLIYKSLHTVLSDSCGPLRESHRAITGVHKVHQAIVTLLIMFHTRD